MPYLKEKMDSALNIQIIDTGEETNLHVNFHKTDIAS